MIDEENHIIEEPEEERLAYSMPKKQPKPKYPELNLPDETVVAAPGMGIHVIKDGHRCWVPDTWTQADLGIRMDYVVILFPEQLLAIPEGQAVPSRIPY